MSPPERARGHHRGDARVPRLTSNEQPPAGGDDFEIAACGLIVLAPDGRIQRVNRLVATWTGSSATELVGRRLGDLLTIGSKLFLQTHWWPLLELQGSVAEVQMELAPRGGPALPILVNAARQTDRRVTVSIFVASDRRKYERELLLARRRAEELLETLRLREAELVTVAENSPDMIVRFDGNQRPSYVSRSHDWVFARDRAEIVGRRLDELGLDPALVVDFQAGVERAFSGHDSSLAFVREAADGSRIDLETRFVGERNADGVVVTALALTRDVTPMKRQEREAEHRAVVAEQMIGIVSHDLRNPLNAILLGTQLLTVNASPKVASTVKRITNAAQRATRLTSELLDFTQARLGGGLRVNRVVVDFHRVVADCVEELRLAWPARSIEHATVGDGMAEVDPDRVAQLATNLVVNAITYGDETTPITVTSVVGADQAELRVSNAGRPIPAELQRAIFEPLQRGEEQVQRGSRSVGLGLYIVREIAASHGGRASVTSNAEDGTTFRIELPRRAPTSP